MLELQSLTIGWQYTNLVHWLVDIYCGQLDHLPLTFLLCRVLKTTIIRNGEKGLAHQTISKLHGSSCMPCGDEAPISLFKCANEFGANQ